jgi:CelD/BcsL family acetyltransferase involved in cellulose biosynthesis
MTSNSARDGRLVFGSELPAGWDELALHAGSPFLTQAWLDSWWRARGKDERAIASLRGDDGTLLAGAAFARLRSGALVATADEHTGDWDVVGVDDRARSELLRQLGSLRVPILVLGPMRNPAMARDALSSSGRRTRDVRGQTSPYLRLPASFDDLLAARSSNLRSQFRRRRRSLEKQGELRLRTTSGGGDLERDLDALFQLEASGWKGAAGTAINSRPDTDALYREFARAAAARSWLRLHILELDGVPVAGDLGCVLGTEAFLIKTGFDESLAGASPGLVLRGEVLRVGIEEGLTGYDFLGGPDPYKLRWTDEVRPRTFVRGYRGIRSAPSEAWHHAVRPALARGRRRMRALRERR